MAAEAREAEDLRMELDVYCELIRTLNMDEDLTENVNRDGYSRRVDDLLKEPF